MNMKYHLIAGPVILVLLLVVYMIAAPKPVEQTAQPAQNDTRFIQISRATWGENCNPALNANGKPNIEPNNVLFEVSQRCNGRIQCQAKASIDFLRKDPLPKGISCGKDLEIQYRCETFKKPTTLTLKEDDSGVIDCTTEKPQNEKTAGEQKPQP